jgi:serine phosphatase RsbU (regulator of sigma subunit)
MYFFNREGARYFRVQTEVELAAEIHRTLVPVIHKTIGSFEIYGASLPSGQVGGDLVDVAEDGGTWMGYVADVSGHGVPSGVLMAMFKTAVRVRGVADASSSILLEKINRALLPLTMPNMFVTASLLQCHDGNQLSASLAGHPPLLHYCKRLRTVSELPAQSLPLGILPEASFATDPLAHEPGDIFVLLTDGLTEVFDAKGNELGIEPIKSALCEHADEPLPQLFQRLREVALNFGRQEDDQTMLLVRQV